jgi:acyl carrier protein
MNTKTKVQDLFKEIFDDKSLLVEEATTANDVEDWDSLNHINLVVGLEKEFDITFALGEMDGLKNVGEIISTIDSKLSNK